MKARNLFFAAGVLLGFALAAGLIWAQIEASFYGFPEYSSYPLRGFPVRA